VRAVRSQRGGRSPTYSMVWVQHALATVRYLQGIQQVLQLDLDVGHLACCKAGTRREGDRESRARKKHTTETTPVWSGEAMWHGTHPCGRHGRGARRCTWRFGSAWQTPAGAPWPPPPALQKTCVAIEQGSRGSAIVTEIVLGAGLGCSWQGAITAAQVIRWVPQPCLPSLTPTCPNPLRSLEPAAHSLTHRCVHLPRVPA
jgi:hypothetical protein